MGIIKLDGDDPALDFERLITDHCVVVVALDHPLLMLDRVTLSDVLAYPVLTPANHASLRDPLATAAAVRGLDVTLAAGSERSHQHPDADRDGDRRAGRRDPAVHDEPTRDPAYDRIVEIDDCQITRTFVIVTAKARPLSKAARSFIEFLHDTTF